MPPRKRAGGRMVNPRAGDVDSDSDVEMPTGTLERADEETLRKRALLRAKRRKPAVTTGQPSGSVKGIFAGVNLTRGIPRAGGASARPAFNAKPKSTAFPKAKPFKATANPFAPKAAGADGDAGTGARPKFAGTKFGAGGSTKFGGGVAKPGLNAEAAAWTGKSPPPAASTAASSKNAGLPAMPGFAVGDDPFTVTKGVKDAADTKEPAKPNPFAKSGSPPGKANPFGGKPKSNPFGKPSGLPATKPFGKPAAAAKPTQFGKPASSPVAAAQKAPSLGATKPSAPSAGTATGKRNPFAPKVAAAAAKPAANGTPAASDAGAGDSKADKYRRFRQLNASFASWVAKQSGENPVADWSEGLKDYLKFAEQLAGQGVPHAGGNMGPAAATAKSVAAKSVTGSGTITAPGSSAASAAAADKQKNTVAVDHPDEDCKFESRAKLYFFKMDKGDDGNPIGWTDKGTGSVMVLQHKENKSESRILFGIATGRPPLLNSGVFSGMAPSRMGKNNVQFAAVVDGQFGKYFIRVKTAELADKMKAALDDLVAKTA